MNDVTKISPFAVTLSLIGRFTEPFKSEKTNKYYSSFVFEGGKFLLEMPHDVPPGVRVRATFEAEFDVIVDARNKSHNSFRPAKALAFEPLK